MPAIAQNVGRQVDLADRVGDVGGRDARRRRGSPHERQSHQRVGVERALEDEAVVALQLAVVGREEDVGVVEPALGLDGLHHAPARLVDQLVHHVRLGVDLADLVVRHRSRAEEHRSAFGIDEAALVPREPMRGLLREDLADLARPIRDGPVAGRGPARAPGAARTRADPTDDAGRESSSNRTSPRPASSESSQSIVRSATQSV